MLVCNDGVIRHLRKCSRKQKSYSHLLEYDSEDDGICWDYMSSLHDGVLELQFTDDKGWCVKVRRSDPPNLDVVIPANVIITEYEGVYLKRSASQLPDSAYLASLSSRSDFDIDGYRQPHIIARGGGTGLGSLINDPRPDRSANCILYATRSVQGVRQKRERLFACSTSPLRQGDEVLLNYKGGGGL